MDLISTFDTISKRQIHVHVVHCTVNDSMKHIRFIKNILCAIKIFKAKNSTHNIHP